MSRAIFLDKGNFTRKSLSANITVLVQIAWGKAVREDDVLFGWIFSVFYEVFVRINGFQLGLFFDI
jgi:hypothetical protein